MLGSSFALEQLSQQKHLHAALSFSLHTLTCAKHTAAIKTFVLFVRKTQSITSSLITEFRSFHYIFEAFIKTFLTLVKYWPRVEKCDTKIKIELLLVLPKTLLRTCLF